MNDFIFERGDLFNISMVSWVLDGSQFDRLLLAIGEADEVIIDLETTGLNEWADGLDQDWPESARIVLAALTLPTKADPLNPNPTTWILPLSHPDSPWLGSWKWIAMEMAGAIADADVPITNQNLKFDLRWIHAITGIDLSNQFEWDTQISSHLIDENSSTKLKERVPATFGVQRWDDFDLSTPAAAEKVPLFDLGLYAARDTYWTWRLATLHRSSLGVSPHDPSPSIPETSEEVLERKLGRLAVWCAMPTSATLTKIEQTGFLLDTEWVNDRIKQATDSLNEHFEFLINRYELPESLADREPSFAPTSNWFREWTSLAVKNRDLVITATTANGKPQWSKSVLTRQARSGSEVADRLLAYRKFSKELEFLRSWLKAQSRHGTIHSTYHAGRVLTGRLSSGDPNMQQITSRLKPAFIPRDGFYIAELDYSQIELRVAAFISRSEPMIEAFQRGDDLHTLLAAAITGKDPKDINSQERQAGKSANFGLLYGMGASGFQEYALDVYGVRFSAQEATLVYDTFFKQWKGLREWHRRMIKYAHNFGQVVSPIGRIRRLPNIYSFNEQLVSSAERAAINNTVQGFASDLMQMAAASIAGNLPDVDPVDGVNIVATVHDSIVVEVPIESWKISTGKCMKRMLNLQPILRKLDCDFDVPLAVEAKIGTRWGLADIGIIS